MKFSKLDREITYGNRLTDHDKEVMPLNPKYYGPEIVTDMKSFRKIEATPTNISFF